MKGNVIKYLSEIEHEKCVSYYQLESKESLSNCFKRAHAHVILDIIYTYLYKRFSDTVFLGDIYNIFIHEGYVPSLLDDSINLDKCGLYCEQLHLLFLKSSAKINKRGLFDRGISKENMLANGAVYTQDKVVADIVEQSFLNIPIGKDTKALDFASGTGRFYEQMLKKFIAFGISIEDAILKCIDAIDIDPVAINILRLKALLMLPDDKVLVHRLL